MAAGLKTVPNILKEGKDSSKAKNISISLGKRYQLSGLSETQTAFQRLYCKQLSTKPKLSHTRNRKHVCKTASSDFTVTAFHPDSKFTRIQFCKTQKQLFDTEQKAPKSSRNSHPTPPNLIGTQRLLKDTSFHYSSVGTTRGSKSTCCKHKATKTLPNSSGRIRTQSDGDENTQNRFRNSQVKTHLEN